jgi:CheY-like chemotaxis protein
MTSLQRILHVEDEPDIQEVARLTLESMGGFTVETCGSGQEALDKAPGFAPDLILLDVMMPGMDGPATLRELRKLPEIAETAIVFMTAKAQTHEIEEFKQMGAADVITKPFDPMTLSGQIRDIWEKHHGR